MPLSAPVLSPAATDRQDFVDGLRGLASFYVVLHHAWLQVWPPGHFPSGSVMVATGWLMWGHFAVSVFIVISGYCLTLPVIRRAGEGFSVIGFFHRRVKRILPPYYLALLFTAFLIYTCVGQETGTHWDSVLPPTPGALARGLLLIPEFGGTINHTYWSIGIECKIYLLFPLFLFLQRRLGVLKTVGLVTVVTFAVAYNIRYEEVSTSQPHYAALFCFGMAAAYSVNSREVFWQRLNRSRLWWILLSGASAAAVLLCVAWGYLPYRFFTIDFFVGAGTTALLIISGRTSHNRIRGVLGWKPLAFLGAFSYSLYLIHAPLLQVVWQYAIATNITGAVPRFLALLAVGVPSILLCAWAFYKICEEPFIPR